MVLRLFRNRSQERGVAAVAEASLPPASVAPTLAPRLIYAIGDIHGRADLLEDIVLRIAEDARRAPVGDEAPLLIFLGDFVDRGPSSADVIRIVIDLMRSEGCEVRALRGNHEELMLDFLDRPKIGPRWAKLGGGATLRSYGIEPPTSADGWVEASAQLRKALEGAHLNFLRGLELYAAYGDYVFVHAGVRPGVPIEKQSVEDLLWIRTEFGDVERPIHQVVVHGHTPSSEPELTNWKIGLDTGAYATGILSAVRLDGVNRKVLQSRSSSLLRRA